MELRPTEIRVLGCLLEKQRTTPDAYPLSLNSLRLACNQSTNRDPVVDYDEATVRDALHRLERHGLVRLAGASRAAKYRHLLAEALPMSDAEQAVMCVLMLRGAQTPGELKQRGERIHSFADLAEVHDTLTRLIERELVQRLARRPGHKEERYAQLLQGEEESQPPPAASSTAIERPGAASQGFAGVPGAPQAPTGGEDAAARALQELSERVARLEREIGDLRAVVQPSTDSVTGR
jgi:uncharacterized protein YceH (UPF0502 family)